MNRITTIALLAAAIITCHAATTTSTISQAMQLAEFDGTITSSKSYKVTRAATISSNVTLPGGCAIYVMPGGSLTVHSSTLTCNNGASLMVMGGALKLVNASISLGQDAHLGLEATSITGTGTVTANGASLTAPIRQIFSPGISVQGKWVIDRAYPQWFATGSSTTDWSEAINKAIEMKGAGEVMLTRGTYTLKHTVYVPMGIHLTGEPGDFTQNDSNHGSTILCPASKGNSFNGGYMLMMNVKHDQNTTSISPSNAQWEKAYALPGTEVSHLLFDCTGGTPRYKAILAAGASTISSNCFNGCLQAVAYVQGNYSDMRRITGNTFNAAGNVSTSQKREILYAFDITGLGDALIFEGNEVNDGDSYTRALHLNMCNGGKIDANVLNADILIENCKGIAYTGNHSEAGAQLTLKESAVTMNGNFFEKGDRPSVVIEDGENGGVSTIAMNGSQFINFAGQRDDNETLNQTLARVPCISDVDVAIGKKSTLTVASSYRYDIPNNSIGSQYPFGLNVAQLDSKGNVKQSAAMRRLAPALSNSGTVASGFKASSAANANPGQASLFLYGTVGNIMWLGSNGNYSYSCKIMDSNGKTTNTLASMPDYKNDKNVQHLSRGGQGLLFNLILDPSWGGEPQPMLAQLTRRGPDGTKTVTVPLAKTRSFFDNGISIAGYKWE